MPPPGWSSGAPWPPRRSTITVFAGPIPGWTGALLGQPAAWTIPIAFATAVVVSLATPGRIPRHTARTMVRLHTPEDLALERG